MLLSSLRRCRFRRRSPSSFDEEEDADKELEALEEELDGLVDGSAAAVAPRRFALSPLCFLAVFFWFSYRRIDARGVSFDDNTSA